MECVWVWRRRGADLQSLASFANQLQQETVASPSPDGVALLQEHLVAKGRAIYRVWFLGRKVQCGVKMARPAPPAAAVADANAAAGFTGGCVGGACAIQPKPKRHAAAAAATTAPPAATATPPAASEFTGGCVGGACAIQPKAKRHAEAAATTTAPPTATPAPLASEFTGGCVGGACAIQPKAKRHAAAAATTTAPPTATPAPPASEFTGGCVGGVCTRPLKRKAKGAEGRASAATPTVEPVSGAASASTEATRAAVPDKPVFSAWRVPDDIASDVAKIVDISQGDCGSVEFMYDEHGGPPVYFDLNMLSTLPIMDGSVKNAEGTWPASFDPWSQLAAHIMSKKC